MRIMLDVGAHLGEILRPALDPRYGFDRIYCFEPAAVCWPRLEAFRMSKVTVIRSGLAASDGHADLFHAGTIGGSVYADKPGQGGDTQQISLIDVATWMRANLSPNDDNYMKLNCEGGEADILDRLRSDHLLHWFKDILVSFDVQKIPSQANRLPQLLEDLEASNAPITRRDVYQSSPESSFEKWLADKIPTVSTLGGSAHSSSWGLICHGRISATGSLGCSYQSQCSDGSQPSEARKDCLA